jgi:tight adherence protein C
MNPLFLLGGFFLLVMATVGAVGFWLVNREEESEPSTSRFQSDLVRDDSRQTWRSIGLDLLHLLGAWIPSSEAKREVMQRRLHAAGYRRTSDINAFFGMKCASAIVLSILFALAASGNQSMVPLSFMCGLGLGFLIPERFLDARIASHNDRLRRALPFALDLMVMSLEAGQALDQAILLSSNGIQVFAPELSAELTQVYLQTRTGMPRQEALRIMAERAREPEVHKFCQLLIDSDRFGSSLAPTLRQHARFLRTRFRQKAQESARKLSVKLVIPIFFLIFPAILVVTLGPAMLTAMRTMHTLLP